MRQPVSRTLPRLPVGMLRPPPTCALISSIAHTVPGTANAMTATNRADNARPVFFMKGLLSIGRVFRRRDYRTGPLRPASGPGVTAGRAPRPADAASSPGGRAAARRAGAGGAAVAVVAGDDAAAFEARRVEVAHVRRRAVVERQVEHLVEVAVVQAAVPADRQRVAAHHAGGRRRVEGLDEAPHVRLVVPRIAQELEEAADRHVG